MQNMLAGEDRKVRAAAVGGEGAPVYAGACFLRNALLCTPVRTGHTCNVVSEQRISHRGGFRAAINDVPDQLALGLIRSSWGSLA